MTGREVRVDRFGAASPCLVQLTHARVILPTQAARRAEFQVPGFKFQVQNLKTPDALSGDVRCRQLLNTILSGFEQRHFY